MKITKNASFRALVLALTLGLAACIPTKHYAAEDFYAEPASNLCLGLAITSITGQDATFSRATDSGQVSQQVLLQELKRRGESCQPWNEYLSLASQRLQYQAQAVAASAEREQAVLQVLNAGVDAYAAGEATQQRSANQQPAAPAAAKPVVFGAGYTTTNCTASGNTANCTTSGH